MATIETKRITDLPVAVTINGDEAIPLVQGSTTMQTTLQTIADQMLTGPTGPAGPAGPTGPTGPTGPAGADGVGIPIAGSTRQALVKNSATNYDVIWSDIEAADVAFDNSASGLVAANVQDALNEIVAGGGGSGSPFLLTFKPNENEPPATNYATLDTRNSRPVLDFDATTQEAAIFTGVLPYGYGGGGVTVDIFCAMTSTASGTVGWDVAFERTQTSTEDIDSDSFATAQTVTATTVPATIGQVLKLSVNVSNGANMDNIAAGELFRLRVRRDVANDTATGDAEIVAVTMREQ